MRKLIGAAKRQINRACSVIYYRKPQGIIYLSFMMANDIAAFKPPVLFPFRQRV
jgi:hypothetical protein